MRQWNLHRFYYRSGPSQYILSFCRLWILSILLIFEKITLSDLDNVKDERDNIFCRNLLYFPGYSFSEESKRISLNLCIYSDPFGSEWRTVFTYGLLRLNHTAYTSEQARHRVWLQNIFLFYLFVLSFVARVFNMHSSVSFYLILPFAFLYLFAQRVTDYFEIRFKIALDLSGNWFSVIYERSKSYLKNVATYSPGSPYILLALKVTHLDFCQLMEFAR